MRHEREELLTTPGMRFEDVTEITALADQLRAQNVCIQRMEVMRKEGEFEIPEIELSIIGADGDENWDEHSSAETMYELARKKLELASASDQSYCARVWFEACPPD